MGYPEAAYVVDEVQSMIKKQLNSTVGTEDFAPLNKQHGRAVFTENGTFKVPNGIHKIFVSAIAAGGDGGVSEHINGSGGGAAGDFCKNRIIEVVPGQEIEITVGAGNTVFGEIFVLLKGGNGAPAAAELPGNGGSGGIGGGGGAPSNTVVNVYSKGGIGFHSGGDSGKKTSTGNNRSGGAGAGGSLYGKGADGQNQISASVPGPPGLGAGGGGNGGTPHASFGWGGGGGGGGVDIFGRGGDGGNYTVNTGKGNDGSGFGSGGGGSVNSASHVGKGAPGVVIIEW